MSLLFAQGSSPLITRLRIMGAGALVLWIIVAVIWPHAAMRSYLFGYLFYIDLSLGMLGLLVLQYATGGAWGAIVRRTCEAGAGVLPLLALLGLPLLIGAPWLFPWADRNAIAADPVIAARMPWIGLPMVAGRSVIFFAILIGVTWLLRKWSLAMDAAAPELSASRTRALAGDRARGDEESRATPNPSAASRFNSARLISLARRCDYLSRFTICALFLIISIWGTDFIMSLEPHWVTTAFGMILVCGQACTAMAFVIIVLAILQRRSPVPLMSGDRVHDLGKLLLTTLVMWAYTSFAQFLIQWLGNTQTDITFYVHRMNSLWSWTGTALIFLHLGLPLVLLLSAPRKRDLNRLARVAVFILIMRWVDTLWMVAPSSLTDQAGWLLPTDFLTPIGIGALWLSVFVAKLAEAPLIARTYETSGANETGLVALDAAEVSHAG